MNRPSESRPPARLTKQERANAAVQVRAVLAAVYAGEIEVTEVQGAYLAGLLDGLDGRLDNTPGVRSRGALNESPGSDSASGDQLVTTLHLTCQNRAVR